VRVPRVAGAIPDYLPFYPTRRKMPAPETEKLNFEVALFPERRYSFNRYLGGIGPSGGGSARGKLASVPAVHRGVFRHDGWRTGTFR